MPRLARPGAVELRWEERGKGPTVVLATNWWGSASIFEGLVADVARDHRVISYDMRGNGESTRSGPYDPQTDAADLAALLEEVGGATACIGWGDGALRAVRVAAESPELLDSVICWGNPLGPAGTAGTDSMADSDGVQSAFQSMLETNFRAAMRTIVTALNPQLDEPAARERVDQVLEYCELEAARERMRASMTDAAVDECVALGDRLWILRFEANPLLGEGVIERTRELAPEARLETLDDGAISRPDLSADVIRRVTAGARERA